MKGCGWGTGVGGIVALVVAGGIAACGGVSDGGGGGVSDGGGGGVSDGGGGGVSDGWLAIEGERAVRFQRELEEARAEQQLPGLAMAIALPETRELWVGATGLAELEAGVPWSPSHHTRIGSVTKTFTTALVFQLVDEGVLSLDDPLERWVPRWYAGVTLRHLLGHTSGIVSYNYVGDFDAARPWTPDELVEWAFAHEPALRFPPGTAWEYSNTNYVLLGLVIEAATGQAFEVALQERLLGPLGLTETRLAGSGDVDPLLVHSYAGTPAVDVSATADPSFGWAAGGMVSTPRDLAVWTVALHRGEVVSAASLRAMMTPGGLTTPAQEAYGLGLFLEGDGTYAISGHTGGIAGWASFAYFLEEPAAALVVLSNDGATDLGAASSYGWAAILGIDYP